MIGHMDSDIRPFKPTGKGGGSKKGKPQSDWFQLFVVGADAMILGAKGTMDSWEKDRSMRITSKVLLQRMDILFPGWLPYVIETMPGRSTDRIILLRSRVYKQYYFGTSAGNTGGPKTRARKSPEHWTYKIEDGHPYYKLHEQIWRGQIVTIDWRQYLCE